MSPTPLRAGGMTYGKTLFLIDNHATVGGLAGGFADLAALDALDVDLERLSEPALSLSATRIAEMGRERGANLVAVGVSDASTLNDLGVAVHAVLPDMPLLYLGVNSPAASPFPAMDRILNHVLVPSDYSARSGCLTSCLLRVARRGVRVVTLMHVPDTGLSSGCVRPAEGEIGRVDKDWIDQLKQTLFSAGVDEVRFVSPRGNSPEFELLTPSVSLVLVGAACRAEVASAYVAAAGHLLTKQHEVPALMLTAESCPVDVRLHGVA